MMSSDRKQKIESLFHLSQKKSLAGFFSIYFGNEVGQFLTATKIFKTILKNGAKRQEREKGIYIPYQIPYRQKSKNPLAISLGYSWGELEKVKK